MNMNKIYVLPADNERNKIIHQTVATDSEKSSKQTKVTVFSDELYDKLIQYCRSNVQYFECHSGSVTNQRFLDAFRSIVQHIEITRKNVVEVSGFAHKYDFDELTPASGYRSILKVIHEYIKHTEKVCKHIAENRGNFLFRKRAYMKEIEACDRALESLCGAYNELIKIRGKCQPGILIPSGKYDAIELFNMSDSIDQKPFYGRCMGLHYCESVKVIMAIVGIGLPGFSEYYFSKRKTNFIIRIASAIYNGSKYSWNAELRAQRYLDLSLHADIGLPKAFLSLTEHDLLHIPPNLFNAKIKVNRLITIEPEPFTTESANEPNKMVQIPIPSSHLGIRPIAVRLLSNVRRDGMQFKRNNHRVHPTSNGLVFHCHGGGFIAHTSKSHEIYLRKWAAKLQVPILSVDYSLSPQAPYPRALEEAFYVYCWAIKNAELLGTTAERIVVVGDSAGAVLNMALTLKCIEQNVRRPDGVLLNYAPLNLGFQPTPSRLLTGMDVLLPFGLLMKVFKAYVHPGDDQFFEPNNHVDEKREGGEKLANSTASITKNRLSLSTDRNPADDFQFDIPPDPFISPFIASDEMLKRLPPVRFVCGEMDPFVDDSVAMAKKLKGFGNSVGLDILSGLPHGFLNMAHLSKDAREGNRICISRLAELLDTKRDPKY